MKNNLYEIIRDRVTDKLKDIIKDLEDGDFDSLNSRLYYSASGDGYGEDNRLIDFSDITINLKDTYNVTDFGEVIDYLKFLKEEKMENKIIEERGSLNEFYVLHYDVESTEYLNDIEFSDFPTAKKKFSAAKKLRSTDRIEIIHSPDIDENGEYGENTVIMAKGYRAKEI